MSRSIEDLIRGGVVITDGAWGTELQARGLATGDFPDAWNLTHPERVSDVAQAYVAAGSQVILTNTFGANRLRLAAHGLAGETAELNRVGVELSRQAAAGRAAVFASIGPTGRMLFGGDTDPDEIRAAFQEQAEALAAAGPDALVVETMSDLEEARLAVTASVSTGLPVVACLVFDSGRNKDRTMMGNTPAQAAAVLAEAGASAIGANCGVGIGHCLPVAEQLRAATGKPIWLKPNAGLPAMEAGRVVYRTTAAEFASHAPALVKAGVNFLGGCCGSTPQFIAALRAVLLPGP